MQEESRGLVLVVEDEKNIADVERLYLTRAGFGVHVEADGRAGLAAARSLRPVAVVLDVGLPTLDGTEVCRALRADGDWTPCCSSLAATTRSTGCSAWNGGRRLHHQTVLAPGTGRTGQVRAASQAGPAGADRVLTVGQVGLDPGRRRVSAQGHEVALTATEFDLLAALLRRPGRVRTREELLSEVWGYAAAAGTRTVDVHVAQLRAKLGAASPERTVRGVG